MSSRIARWQRELERDSALCRRILRELPPVPVRERVTVRTDAASVDLAISRALALAANGILPKLEFDR